LPGYLGGQKSRQERKKQTTAYNKKNLGDKAIHAGSSGKRKKGETQERGRTATDAFIASNGKKGERKVAPNINILLQRDKKHQGNERLTSLSQRAKKSA